MLSKLQSQKYFKICNSDLCHKTLSIKAKHISTKEGICVMTLKPWHMNFEKCAHGGVLFSLMDTTMGFCVYPHLKEDEIILAVNLNINYLKPAVLAMKHITCRGKLVSRSRRLAVSEGEVLSPKGDVLCKALGTFAILKKEK